MPSFDQIDDVAFKLEPYAREAEEKVVDMEEFDSTPMTDIADACSDAADQLYWKARKMPTVAQITAKAVVILREEY